jgi:hypothetical protein
MDNSAVTVLGAPCTSSSCNAGATGTGGTSSDGKAQGGQFNITAGGETLTNSGTLATDTTAGTGRQTLTGPVEGTASGNFNTLPGNGHCTGAYSTAGTICKK